MKIDVRYKFLLLIIISVVSFWAKDIHYGSMVFLIVCILAFLTGRKKRVIKFGVTYLFLLGFIWGTGYIPAILKSMFLMFVLCIRMFMPALLYTQTFIETTTVSEMITGMYALRLPRSFVITFAVAMRFFPTAKEELSYIKDAMKMRGIQISLHNLVTRPSILIEGFMTPLLVRAFTIAEELSAAAITRGLDNPDPRTAFVRLHVGVKDTMVMFLFSLALCCVVAAKFLTKGAVS